MKIRKLVLMAIRGNTGLRRKIKEALEVSEPTFQRYLSDNSDMLTKAAVVRVIREELDISDSEILEEEENEPETVNK